MAGVGCECQAEASLLLGIPAPYRDVAGGLVLQQDALPTSL